MQPQENHGTNEEIAQLETQLAILKGRKKKPLIPLAIITGGVIIAISIFFSEPYTPSQNTQSGDGTYFTQELAPPRFGGKASNIQPVTANDHTRGTIDAPVTIIEYSDFECPFCKEFHPTLEKVLETYKEDGTVLWVYRHFPLDNIHSQARIEAAATELASELGGNDTFWEYIEKLFKASTSNDTLDLNILVDIAISVGLDAQPFKDLVGKNDSKGAPYANIIEQHYKSAVEAGGAGTPYTVIIAPNGKTFPLTGAQTYATVVSLIEIARKETTTP